MRTSHDMIVRYSQLLAPGAKTADWAAAGHFIDALSDEVAEEQLEDAGVDVDDIAYELVKASSLDDDYDLPDAEIWRRYLRHVVDGMAEESARNKPQLPGHYPLDWRGRLGFVIEGYDFDNEPEDTIPCRILRTTGVLEAAGFELLP